MSGGEWRRLAKRALGRAAGVVRTAPPPAAVRSLLYHSIAATDSRDRWQMTTPVDLFDAQMAYLAESGHTVMQPAEVLRRWTAGEPVPERTVSITFDDGFVDNFDLALPVLRKYRFPATVFVVSSWGTRPDGYLTTAQMREMTASGLVEFGCHTATHRRLDGLGAAVLDAEVRQAKAALEERLDAAVSLFAYPFGSYGTWDAAVLATLRTVGFRGAFTSIFGANTPVTDRLLLRRSRVSWCDTIPEFRRLLAGAHDWYAWVQRLQRPLGAS